MRKWELWAGFDGATVSPVYLETREGKLKDIVKEIIEEENPLFKKGRKPDKCYKGEWYVGDGEYEKAFIMKWYLTDEEMKELYTGIDTFTVVLIPSR